MRGWLGGVDRTTKRVFKTATVALFFAPWIAVLLLFFAPLIAVLLSGFAPRPLPSQVDDSLGDVFLAFFAPLYLPLSIFWLAVDALGGPEYVDGTLFAFILIPLSPLLVAVNALLWATIIAVAFVVIRHLRERRAASKGGVTCAQRGARGGCLPSWR